jgi:hypothetical protein
MLSRKHYKAIANIITKLHWKEFENEPIVYISELTKNLAVYFKEDNPKFKIEKFINACYIGE